MTDQHAFPTLHVICKTPNEFMQQFLDSLTAEGIGQNSPSYYTDYIIEELNETGCSENVVVVPCEQMTSSDGKVVFCDTQFIFMLESNFHKSFPTVRMSFPDWKTAIAQNYGQTTENKVGSVYVLNRKMLLL